MPRNSNKREAFLWRRHLTRLFPSRKPILLLRFFNSQFAFKVALSSDCHFTLPQRRQCSLCVHGFESSLYDIIDWIDFEDIIRSSVTRTSRRIGKKYMQGRWRNDGRHLRRMWFRAQNEARSICCHFSCGGFIFARGSTTATASPTFAPDVCFCQQQALLHTSDLYRGSDDDEGCSLIKPCFEGYNQFYCDWRIRQYRGGDNCWRKHCYFR